ncbi:unnamed protein product [Amoebophrya sp. A25]|nr:unnamed protein product [Amoebophrya sp. A25]|eukprot:GSA25T00004161001.1
MKKAPQGMKLKATPPPRGMEMDMDDEIDQFFAGLDKENYQSINIEKQKPAAKMKSKKKVVTHHRAQDLDAFAAETIIQINNQNRVALVNQSSTISTSTEGKATTTTTTASSKTESTTKINKNKYNSANNKDSRKVCNLEMTPKPPGKNNKNKIKDTKMGMKLYQTRNYTKQEERKKEKHEKMMADQEFLREKGLDGRGKAVKERTIMMKLTQTEAAAVHQLREYKQMGYEVLGVTHTEPVKKKGPKASDEFPPRSEIPLNKRTDLVEQQLMLVELMDKEKAKDAQRQAAGLERKPKKRAPVPLDAFMSESPEKKRRNSIVTKKKPPRWEMYQGPDSIGMRLIESTTDSDDDYIVPRGNNDSNKTNIHQNNNNNNNNKNNPAGGLGASSSSSSSSNVNRGAGYGLS